jgi:hypothetical protein
MSMFSGGELERYYGGQMIRRFSLSLLSGILIGILIGYAIWG